MKNTITMIAAACAAIMMTFTASAAQKQLKGSGKIVTRKQTISADYTAIDASRAVRVVMDDSAGNEVTIKADDNVMPYVVCKVEGKTLKVGIDGKFNSISNISVEILLPRNSKLQSLEASSASQIDIRCDIKGDKFEVDASSAAKIHFTKADVKSCGIEAGSAANVTGSVKADACTIDTGSAAKVSIAMLAVKCSVDASSASKTELSGEAGTLIVDSGSAASVDAEDLNARNVSVDASSGSGVKVCCLKKLVADASSGASVRYKGDCEVSIDKSSGGSVKRM